MDDLYLALHNSAARAKGGITGLARRKGWRVQTAINKVNPHDQNAEPKVGEFIAILQDSGDTMPLEIMCSMFGGRFTTRINESRRTVLEAVLHAASEQGDIPRAIDTAMADDGKIDAGEMLEILKEISEARDALSVLENTVREKCEQNHITRIKQ
ncbi:MAG: phage regulatory CII family protein [Candidatus Sedimenticola sp. (ex Thyasira tokunagai)]